VGRLVLSALVPVAGGGWLSGDMSGTEVVALEERYYFAGYIAFSILPL